MEGLGSRLRRGPPVLSGPTVEVRGGWGRGRGRESGEATKVRVVERGGITKRGFGSCVGDYFTLFPFG